MSTYWVTGADIFSRATELMIAEANPVAAGRAAVEEELLSTASSPIPSSFLVCVPWLFWKLQGINGFVRHGKI